MFKDVHEKYYCLKFLCKKITHPYSLQQSSIVGTHKIGWRRASRFDACGVAKSISLCARRLFYVLSVKKVFVEIAADIRVGCTMLRTVDVRLHQQGDQFKRTLKKEKYEWVDINFVFCIKLLWSPKWRSGGWWEAINV